MKQHQTFDNSTVPPLIKWFGRKSCPDCKKGFEKDERTTRGKTSQIPTKVLGDTSGYHRNSAYRAFDGLQNLYVSGFAVSNYPTV